MMANELFDTGNISRQPLAARMRARNLDEYIGQSHILGEGRLLRRCIARDRLSSVIFYGPPGVGKTTLARVIANHTKSAFITLNAVLTGVADIRAAIKDATEYYSLYSRRTILFVDEVHRWSKSQQDALLPYVENGTVILIGATTENPFFEVNRALVSRSRIFQLKPLTSEDLKKIALQAINDSERGYGKWVVEFEKGALEHIIDSSSGDARNLLNALELAVETTPSAWDPSANPPQPPLMSTIYITKRAAEESIQKKVVLYDKDGDYHYDVISAFIKSLRGRDPDAALYYLARMISAGEDPHFIFRRMLISSCEDTGLADPNAITVINSCAEAFDRVGLPEGRYFLAHAALYLSTAPKSNSSMAFFDALKVIEASDALNAANSDVPNHLKDPSRDAKGFGHGSGYKYPHEYTNHWVAQQYLPKELVGKVFYTPSTQGYEGKIREEVLARREAQLAIILKDLSSDEEPAKASSDPSQFADLALDALNSEENFTYSPPDARRESALDKADRAWRARLDENRAQTLLFIRGQILLRAKLLRNTRVLIWGADDGLLLWEAMRSCPEGVVAGVCRSKRSIEILNQYAATLDEIDKPMLFLRNEGEEKTNFKASQKSTWKSDNERAKELTSDGGARENRNNGNPWGSGDKENIRGSGYSGNTEGSINSENIRENGDEESIAGSASSGSITGSINSESVRGNGEGGAINESVSKSIAGGINSGSIAGSGGKAASDIGGAYIANAKGATKAGGLGDAFLSGAAFNDVLLRLQYKALIFDKILFYNPFSTLTSIEALADALKFVTDKTSAHIGKAFLDDEGSESYESEILGDEGASMKATLPEGFALIASQRIPRATQHLSRVIQNQVLTPSLVGSWIEVLSKMDDAESKFFCNKSSPNFCWDEGTVTEIFQSRGFFCECQTSQIIEKRRISDEDIKRWFDSERSPYGAAICKSLGSIKSEEVAALLQKAAKKQTFDWSSRVAFFRIMKGESG